MATVTQILFNEYPIPEQLSVWGSTAEGVPPVADLEVLLESCVRDLQSDLYVVESIRGQGMYTQLPEDTLAVLSAKLDCPAFQGNRLVKCTYERGTKIACLRYFPAEITYKRRLNSEDLSNLSGDQFIFFRSYVLYKMAEKELNILSAVDLSADNGKLNLEVLRSFRDSNLLKYTEMKKDILIYSGNA